MTALLFGGVFKFDADHPEHPKNDRLVFSKGHASPLFYGLWGAAGKLTQADLMTYRTFGSPLEGHPTYDRLKGGDGFVSLEVNPHLAYGY
jgi:transketolase